MELGNRSLAWETLAIKSSKKCKVDAIAFLDSMLSWLFFGSCF
jgi:hypothetical protein